MGYLLRALVARLGVLALVSPLLLVASRVCAQGDGVIVEYVGPPGCGSKAEVIQRFYAALGTERAAAASLRATIAVEPRGSHYSLRYNAEVRGARTERTLEAESCGAVVEAAALLLLISVDPTLASVGDTPRSGSENSPPTPADEPGSPSPTASPGSVLPGSVSPGEKTKLSVTAPAALANSPQPKGRAKSFQLGGFVGANLEATSSLAPSFALGGSLEAGARLGMIWVGVRGGLESTPSAVSLGLPGADMTALLGRVHGWVGGFAPVGRFRMGPYLGVGVEVLQLWARGLASGGSGSTPFLSARAGGRLFWSLSPSVALGLDLGMTVPLERPAFVVTGLEAPAHRPAAISGDVAFGVNWSFGSQ